MLRDVLAVYPLVTAVRLHARATRTADSATPGSPAVAHARSSGERRLERETGIEPATNSLEGCDSTTELLPPSRLARSTRPFAASRAGPARRAAFVHQCRPTVCSVRNGCCPSASGLPSRSSRNAPRAKVGGEGRTRTFEATRATDLQSAAFDRSATSPVVCVGIVDVVLALRTGLFSQQLGPGPGLAPMELAKGFEPPTS